MLHVLDLPQLYTKPPAHALLDALDLLTVAPPSWDQDDAEDIKEGNTQYAHRSGKAKPILVNPEGVTSYLTSIVGSSLQWIDNDEDKEKIWDHASMRLSERSGRTARGALSRDFRIPSTSGPFQLSIHEPALTGDDLGLKTWAASYLLAKRLYTIGAIEAVAAEKSPVLELGSGTGLVGMAMAGLGGHVVLTDLPSIYSNLVRNIDANIETIESRDGSIRSGVLDWTDPVSCQVHTHSTSTSDDASAALEEKFPLILAADSLYSPEHPRMLVDTIATWLSDGPDAKVIVEFPLREAYLPEIKDFCQRMSNLGLHLLQEGEEEGYDDWGAKGEEGDDNERGIVRCWWSIWGR